MTSGSSIPDTNRPASKHLRVVLAGTEFKNQEVLIGLLREKGLDPILSSSLNETESRLAHEDTALVICHAHSRDGDFRHVLSMAAPAKVPVVLCADFYDPHLYLEAMELGAFDYFVHPYYRDGVDWVVGNALTEAQNKGRVAYGATGGTYEAASC
jgi:DNA-binding NtrC family response regulator